MNNYVSSDTKQKELMKPATPDVFVIVSSRKATFAEMLEQARDEESVGNL